LRVDGGRTLVIVGGIPIATPDVHQISHIMQTITVRRVMADEIRLFSRLTAAVRVHPLW
jgi:hypothetical protein